MNLFSLMKGSAGRGQMMQRLLIMSLWGSVLIFFGIAFILLFQGWDASNVRMALMISGLALVLLLFTRYLQKSLDVHGKPKTLEAYYELALLQEETEDLSACQHTYETMIDQFDQHLGPAYLSLAALYLKQADDEKAMFLVEHAAKEDWVWYLPGLEMLADYYKETDTTKQAEMKKAISRVKELEAKASQEIYYFSEQDVFQAIDQPVANFEPVIRILQAHLDIQKLYLVKKKIETIPNRNVYTFAIVVNDIEQAKAYEEKIYQDCYEQVAKPLGKYSYFTHTLAFIMLDANSAQDQKLLDKISVITDAQVELTN